LTAKKHEFEHDVKLDVEARVRQGVKAVLEEVLEEEMTQHLKTGYREFTPTTALSLGRPLHTQPRDPGGQGGVP
jgi:transposase-like protein